MERSGIFMKMTLAPDESIEEALEYQPRERPILGRVLDKKLNLQASPKAHLERSQGVFNKHTMLTKPTIASRNFRCDPKTLDKGGGREELNKTMERLVKHVDLKNMVELKIYYHT